MVSFQWSRKILYQSNIIILFSQIRKSCWWLRNNNSTLNLKIFHENHIISKWSGGYLQIHIIEKEQMNYQINLAHGLLMNLVDRKFGFYFSVFLFKRKSTTIDKKCTCILCFENRLSICYGYIHRKFFSESTNWNGPQALKC